MIRRGSDFDESDVRIRPSRRGSRPRSKDRPAHEDAIPGFVIGVDRGRYTVLVRAGVGGRKMPERTVIAMRARELGRKGIVVGDDVELVGAGGLIERLRARKDPEELAAIRRAAKLADEALEEVLAAGVVGRTEQEVALDLEFAMRRRGAQAASFPPIVAAGEHGALPHAHPRDVAIPPDTLLVIDWGAMLDGYASDCTRTFATGELDPRDAEVYDLVLTAQKAALAAVAPGPTGKEVDAVARDIIEAGGHAEHFGHGLGHGVGLEVHEGPRLNKQSDEQLVEGMVVTVEPGIYVPGAVGVRIEDLVFVTADGHEVANTLPKDLRVVA